MDFEATLPGNQEYPPPPRVHWLTLFIGWSIIAWLVSAIVSMRYRELVQSLVFDGWAFYLCRWIHKVNPNSLSPFWCDVYVVVQLASAALSVIQRPSRIISMTGGVLELASVILAIATVFLIRADLLEHYNKREPIGLELGPFMTLFFSFLYFQAKLREIAEFKEREAKNDFSNPSRTLLS
jgi:hypothetical protein